MLLKAREQAFDDRLFLRWAIGYQFEISFDQFKNNLFSREKPVEEVLEDVNGIIELFNGSGLKALPVEDV